MDCLDKYISSKDLQYIICGYLSPCKDDLHTEIKKYNFYTCYDQQLREWLKQRNLNSDYYYLNNN